MDFVTDRLEDEHPSDLVHYEFVLFGGWRTVALQGPKGGAKVAGRASANDLFFLREAIAAGLGIGPLPWYLANPELAAGRITRVLPEYRVVGGASYLVYPPANPLSPKLVAFCSYLLEQAPRLIVQPE